MKTETSISEIAPTFPTLEKIESVEKRLLDLPQVEMPLKHTFAPGVYFREIFMPKGIFVIGHKHKTTHFNIVLTGRASIICDGNITEVTAPSVFVSGAGVRKVLYILEDMRWATIHPTDETDLEKLESELIEKSQSWQKHRAELQMLRIHADREDYRAALNELGFTHERVRQITENENDQIPMPIGIFADVRPSMIDGLGLFARFYFLPGAVISPARLNGKRTPAGRFTNHSANPNARMEALTTGQINLVASSIINAGDEITVDYRQAKKQADIADVNMRGII